MSDSFGSRRTKDFGDGPLTLCRIDAVPGSERLPNAHKILLENLLRHENGVDVTAEHSRALVETGRGVIQFHPSRVFLHDTNGVPVLNDLAALRAAVAAAGGDPRVVNPAIPAELTVDHSVSTDVSGRADARARNIEREYERNAERYGFLKWSATMDGFRVVPPGSGIMHQINLEYLARVVEARDGWLFPDTCAGTDSHTTMVNGLGVLAWGVGGIEAEAALLGMPVSMVVPPVLGLEFTGKLRPGVTATDLVLTIVELLRAHGVVGSIVEFHGESLGAVPLADRATIANMCPEFGATAALFPIDDVTLDYLRLTGRSPAHVDMVEWYAKEQGLWAGAGARYHEELTLDLSTVEPSLAGPRRPQDRVPLADSKPMFLAALEETTPGARPAGTGVTHGSVAIAAITSCTNTSNPSVMVGAGLLARNARARGLRSKPWVKTSLAPGSPVVTDYLREAGLTRPLDELGFQLVGYGCMTCIGNSGPLLPEVADAVARDGLSVAAVLSGNRNFDGRINNDVAMNYLASPPLVIAYALAGTMDIDLLAEPLGHDSDGEPVFLADIWPEDHEIQAIIGKHLDAGMFTSGYANLFDGDDRWRALDAPRGELFEWAEDSTYLRRPPFLDNVTAQVPAPQDIRDARVLIHVGDSVTTDHIIPAGRIPATGDAGRYLTGLGVAERDLNTYASRRGNHEVMLRGAFSNPRLGNRLGNASVYETALSYRRRNIPLLILAGAAYGTGSSRDWAAKVTALSGVRAVLAESYERIHRSNLIGTGVLPLEYLDGENAALLGLDGTESYDVLGIPEAILTTAQALATDHVTVRARRAGGETVEFRARVRLDTPVEADYYRHGGILPLVYRKLTTERQPS